MRECDVWPICAFGLLFAGACGPSLGAARPNQTPVMSVQEIEFDRPDGLSAPASGIIDDAVVQFDLKTRTIRTVEGRVRMGNATGPEAAAKRFVESTFRLSFSGDAPTRLQADRNTETLGGHRFIYQLYYVRTDNGTSLPIAGQTVIVNVGPANEISYATNDTVPISNPVVIRPASAVPRAVAEKAVLAEHGADVSIAAATQLVDVVKGTPVLLWKVTLLKRSPSGSFEVLIDGTTGRVVSNRNTSIIKN